MRSAMTILGFFLALSLAILLVSLPAGAADGGPPLDVSTPQQNVQVNNSTMSVMGITAPNATINVTLDSIIGTRTYFGTAEPEGTFEVLVELFEGHQKIIVKVTDDANRTNETFRDVALDTVPPCFEIISPPSSPVYTNQLSYRIVVRNMYECQMWLWVLGVQVYGSGMFETWVDLHEGENNVDVLARDGVGNEAIEWLVFHVDVTPPVLNVWEPDNVTVFTNRTGIHLEGNVSGATEVVIEHKAEVHNATLVEGDLEAGGVWEYDVVLEPVDLETYIIVRALDHVGNEKVWYFNVTYDTVSPKLEIWPPLPMRANFPCIYINGTTETGVQIVNISGMHFPVEDGRFSVIVALKKGPNQLRIEVQDAAGNGQVVHAYVLYDKLRLDLDVPKRTESSSVHIKGTTEEIVEVVRIDGVPYPVENGTFDVEVYLDKGKNTFKVEVEDPYGNVDSERVEVEYDTPGFGALSLCIAIVLAVVVAERTRLRA